MSSVYIEDAVGGENVNARKEIKDLCGIYQVSFGETLDKNGAVSRKNAEIVIAHLGYITGVRLETIAPKLKELSVEKSNMETPFLIIGVSSDHAFIEESRRCSFPAFYYSNVIQFLKQAFQESKNTRKNLRVCLEGIIRNYKQIRNIIRNFLPLDIDIQALSDKKVTNKIEYLKEMLKDTEKGFYTKKLEMVNNLINEMVDGNTKDKINGLFTKDNYIKKILNRLDEMKGKFDTLKEEDVHNIISDSSTNFPSFYHWYTSLASCLSD